MDDNRKFELEDDALDEVAGGAGSGGVQSVTYNGMTWTVGQLVSVPRCSASNCGSLPAYNAVITRLNALNRNIGYENTSVYVLMDCCKKQSRWSIKDLQPYKRLTCN